jgi:hypothetical protein
VGRRCKDGKREDRAPCECFGRARLLGNEVVGGHVGKIKWDWVVESPECQGKEWISPCR